MNRLLLTLFVALSCTALSGRMYAQANLSHEVGAFFGIASLQTDFGISGEFAAANQASMAFGLSYYMKFFGSQYNWRSGSSYFSDHFKLKFEFSYINNSKITHEGINPGSAQAEKLEAMTGAVTMYNGGLNLEYYFLELEDYTSFFRQSGSVNPFISLGLHYTYAQPDILVDGQSLKGQEEPYEELIEKWQENAVFLEPQNIISAAGSIGVRFGLEAVDIVVEGRYQYYFSDQLEGLNAKDDPANKNNDSMVFANVGIVYVFGK